MYMTEKDNIFIDIDVSKTILIFLFGISIIKLINTHKVITEFINQELVQYSSAIKLCVLKSTGGYST